MGALMCGVQLRVWSFMEMPATVKIWILPAFSCEFVCVKVCSLVICSLYVLRPFVAEAFRVVLDAAYS